MDRRERHKEFVAALKMSALITDPARWKFSQGTGVSNSPKFVALGLELLDADLNGVNPEGQCDGFVLWGTIIQPPGNEIFIAVYIRRDREIFLQRLAAMRAAGETWQREKKGPELFHKNNNNVTILVSQSDRKLYLRNKGHWTEAEDQSELAEYGPGLEADRVEFAIYQVNPSATRGFSVGVFVAYLAELFPAQIIHEISPWDADSDVPLRFTRNPAVIPVAEIRSSIKQLGGQYPDDLVEHFHVALNHLHHKHFVILSGLSGLGKTGLVLRYAMAVHGATDSTSDDRFLVVCAVKPDWTDPSGLLGYYDVILSRYVVPPFLSALLAAVAHPRVPVFVCIDEMNIARVEYYFADILSALESRHAIHLHDNPNAYEGTNGAEIPQTVPMPTNLYIVGTVNVDETTYRISDKVLDRANTITLDQISVDDFFDHLAAREPELTAAIKVVRPFLRKVIDVLQPFAQGFGYRVMEEFARYFQFASETATSQPLEILDHQIRQKVLVKLHGSERERKMLVDISEVLKDLPQSLARIQSMQRDLEHFGSF